MNDSGANIEIGPGPYKWGGGWGGEGLATPPPKGGGTYCFG